MDEQQTVETKKKVDKTCRMCYHCRIRMIVNLNDIMSTVIVPVNRREGVVAIYCRKDWWRTGADREPLLFNVDMVNRIEILCPHFEGEDDEEDNSTVIL